MQEIKDNFEVRKENISADEKKKKKKKKKQRKKRRRTIKWIFISILIVIAAIAVILFARFYPLYKQYSATANELLMNMDADTFRRSGNTYVYDKDGTLIGEIGSEKYEYVEISDVSDYVVDGYIAQEDKKFLSHNGVDIKATARAAVKLVQNKGEITQGGSTITQQVVKNNLLSQEQTYTRKVMEILMAFQIEKQFSKNQIMEFYVNSNYYGESCYGIEGASEYYFGKSASSLTLAEAAILVATSNSPSTVNPVVDYDGILEKKNEVLGNMLEEGYITQEEYDTAAAEEPEVVQQSSNADGDNYMISYALHCTTIELMEDDGFEFQYVFETADEYSAYEEEYNETYYETLSTVRSGGYSIYTSFDTAVQEKLQQAVDNGLSSFTDTQEDGRYEMQGAAVCIDNETGMVIAMVGGRGTSDSYNRGYQAERQPGSSIKPLLDYAPAINEGHLVPDTVYNDAQFDDNGYSPENSGGHYYGNVTAREALARSLNTVALQIFINTGRDTSLSYLDKMQFSSLAYADSTVDSISIGGFTNGTTVEDMAKGYATLANGGTYTDATCLVKVLSESGEELYKVEEDAKETEVYLADTAFMVTDMLEGVFEESYGTAHDAQTDSQVYAGKTGTTNDNKDAWFAGYSAYYTTVVWCGCDTPESVDGLNGSSYPLSIWSDFMEQMHEGLEKKDFTVPSTVYLENSGGDTKSVDYSTNVYSSRPSGYDYRSGQLDEVENQKLKETELKNQILAAETAVSEFEDYQITDYTEAANLDTYYNEVLDVINEVEDADEQADFKDRAAYKYELLSGEVAESWADAAEKAAEAEQAQKDADNEIAAQESILAAEEAATSSADETRAQNVRVVNWYIEHLNEVQYYTGSVQDMISDARTALRKCTSYSSYDSLYEKLESAIEYAKSRPSRTSNASSDPDIDDYDDGVNDYD